MKRLIIIVEGQTEEEFIKVVVAPYLWDKFKISSVVPIKIATRAKCKGGFVDYKHLRKDIGNVLHESDVVVSMFIDFFRIPDNIPNYSSCMSLGNTDNKIKCLEDAIKDDIGSKNFIPYIQKHEFEALLFSSNDGFIKYYEEKVFKETQRIIDRYSDPEEINSNSAPSKRIMAIISNYKKVSDGRDIALEIGIDKMMEKCQHFKSWIENLIKELNRD